jgi:hypothetical protein
LAWLLFAVFIVVPLLEIFAFIEVGSAIGALPTLALIVLTAVVGALLVRWQGLKVAMDARQSMARDELPVAAVVHGVLLLFAGTSARDSGLRHRHGRLSASGAGIAIAVGEAHLGLARGEDEDPGAIRPAPASRHRRRGDRDRQRRGPARSEPRRVSLAAARRHYPVVLA